MSLFATFNSIAFVVIMMIGLYTLIARQNLVKKTLGLGLFQTGIFLMYITLGVRDGGSAPILQEGADLAYSNPLPHVLMLTAIVVGVATTALALSLVVRINEAYETIEEDELEALDGES